MKKQIRMGLACILASAMTIISGCGNRYVEPELLDPVASVESYFTVSRGDIGDIYSFLAYVVPKMDICYAQVQGQVDSFEVMPGDTVKKGQVLVRLDTKSAEEQKNQAQLEYQNQEASAEVQVKVIDLQMRKNEYAIAKLSTPGAAPEQDMDDDSQDTPDPEDIPENPEQQIAILKQENVILQHKKENIQAKLELRKKQYNKQVSKMNETLSDTTIVAPCDGVLVGFSKDVQIGETVMKGDCVAILANEAEHYVQCVDSQVNSGITDNQVQNADSIVAQINGKEYPIQKHEYSTEERMNAQAAGLSLPLIFDVEENDAQIGDGLVIFLSQNVTKQALYVPKRAVVSDGDKKYVYLKDGDDRKKQEVQTGKITQHYVVIEEGLAEGDVVVFDEFVDTWNDPLHAEDHVVNYTVYREDLVENGTEPFLGNKIIDYGRESTVYWNGEDATFVRYLKAEGDAVKKGDTIAYIDNGGSKSAATQMKNQVDACDVDYKKIAVEYDEAVKELQGKLQVTTDENEKGSLTCDLEIAKLQYENQLAENRRQYDVLNKQYKELLGTQGQVPLKANMDGVIASLRGKSEGETVFAAEQLVRLQNQSQPYVKVSGAGLLAYGDEVELHSTDGKTYHGTVISTRNQTGVSEGKFGSDNVIRIQETDVDYSVSFADVTYSHQWSQGVMVVPRQALYGKYRFRTEGMPSINVKLYVYTKAEDGSYVATDVNAVILGDYYWILDGLTEGTEIYYETSNTMQEEVQP